MKELDQLRKEEEQRQFWMHAHQNRMNAY